MNFRKFGKTDLSVSEIGFGAWGIGGPAMAGDIAIGWGDVDDSISKAALLKANELGVNFYDTADFYGLGHSEKLIGDVFGKREDILIATKVGHRLAEDHSILLDYSKEYILSACEESLKRLKRDYIDYYQLHSAKLNHIKQGDCIEAMEILKSQGKIRYWGISLNTFNPFPEAEYFISNNIGDGFQLVLNIINQRANKLVENAGKNNFGVIARMPIQFGLLTGKFSGETKFNKNDHRYFRLTPEILYKSLIALKPAWHIAEKNNISKTCLALSFILSFNEVTTVIPGIKTPVQAESNTSCYNKLSETEFEELKSLYSSNFADLINLMENQG